MAVDYCVSFECELKKYFGKGDALNGTVAILDMLKAEGRGEVIRELAEQEGRDPYEMQVTLRVPGPNGHPIEKQVTLADLEKESAPLKARSQVCSGCPANVTQSPYGCFGAVNYPISYNTEIWISDRIYSSDISGNFFCYHFMKENRVSGKFIKQLRKQGLFESHSSPIVVFERGFFSKKSVTSDQIFEVILRQEQFVTPEICLNVLVWLGAIQVQGRPQWSTTESGLIAKLLSLRSVKERFQWTRFEIDSDIQDPAVASMGELIKAMYLSWGLGVPLLVSA